MFGVLHETLLVLEAGDEAAADVEGCSGADEAGVVV